MRVLIAGGTGFVGSYLVWVLRQAGHEVLVLSRRPGAELSWDGRTSGPWAGKLAECDAVVNLSGESIAAGRWTKARKSALRDSRLDSTRALVDAIGSASKKPDVLVNASAVGYYGDRADEVLSDSSAPGRGFLADLCRQWEAEALKAEAHGVRVVVPRIGVVLGPGGGALPRMALPFKLFGGGPIGSGKQWLSWVSREDLAGLIVHALTHELKGPFNAVSPNPARNADFSRELGRTLGRPSWLPAPPFALRLALGEMADELLLASQKCVPQKALSSGYKFAQPDLPSALKAALL